MKVMSILGTRPEIIRMSQIIPKLDKAVDHILIHTGQNYDENMSAVFFKELNIREPDANLKIGGQSVGCQMATLFIGMEDVINKYRPDRLLILGDTNSALGPAIMARRLGVKVYHMEAGNRSFNVQMPEEINRRIIDHCSDIHMPYTERSRDNLLREGIEPNKIFVTGNPIKEVLDSVETSFDILESVKDLAHDIISENINYFLVTAHRQENVDSEENLSKITHAMADVYNLYKIPVIFSCHPRTRERIKQFNLEYVPFYNGKIIIHEPFKLTDFLTLENCALCVLTDSGTVQEECCIFKTPCVTIRDTTERPETIECGSNILSGLEPESILRCVKLALSKEPSWNVPAEYMRTDVSDTVVKIVAGY
jgi:UDP-N-acetylglucosamine 2-epimerase (non-hydrolysing)